MSDAPLDHGRTIYTCTVVFSNDYPTALDPTLSEGNPLHWNWADLLDEPDARCVAVVETPNPDYGTDAVGALDALHRRLAAWEEGTCEDPEQTLTAFRYMGILSAASALVEMGYTLPDRWLSDQTVAVHEMIGDESCSGCSEWFVSGECIPCETCDGSFCPACETKPCAEVTR